MIVRLFVVAIFSLTFQSGCGRIWGQVNLPSTTPPLNGKILAPCGSVSPFKLIQAVPGTLVNEPSVWNSTTSQSLTENGGNLLVAIVYSGQMAPNTAPNQIYSVSDTLGNTYFAGPMYNNNSTNSSNVQIFFATNIAAGANTVTATTNMPPNGIIGLWLTEYSGVATTNVVDIATGQTGGASTINVVPGNMTTTSTCDLVVGAFADGSVSGQTLDVGSGWTKQSSDEWDPAEAVDNVNSGAAVGSTVNPLMLLQVADNNWLATQIAFRSASSNVPPQPTQLAFSTAPQTASTWSCSPVTIQSQNGIGTPTNTSSGISIALAGATMNYYADSNCFFPITSTNIGAGTNSQTFYFSSSAIGGPTLSATPVGFGAINQIETINALNPFTWIGGAGCAQAWGSTGTADVCWQGGFDPGPGAFVHFDANCALNCSPTFSANINVSGVWMHAGYGGTINQAAHTFTIQRYFLQDAGNFAGGTVAITDNGNFTLNGGNFQSTSATFSTGASNLLVPGNFIVNGGVFNPNGGTVEFGHGISGFVQEISTAGVTFNKLLFDIGQWNSTYVVGTIAASSDVTINEPNTSIMNGTISTAGNLAITNMGGQSTAALSFTGGAAQSFTMPAGTFFWGTITVAKTAATILTLNAGMALPNNNQFKITSGTVKLNTNILSTGGNVTVTGASSILQCNGGCGLGTACNQGIDLLCGSLTVNAGGTVTP